MIGKWAIKFPRLWSWELFVEGLLSNALEAQFYKRLKMNGADVLVAPHLFGKAILVMARCEPLTEEEFEKLDRSPWMKPRDSYEGFEPRYKDNFGKYEGRVVAVDYGLPDWVFYEQRNRWEREHPDKPFRD